jgi:hypothetical protein
MDYSYRSDNENFIIQILITYNILIALRKTRANFRKKNMKERTNHWLSDHYVGFMDLFSFMKNTDQYNLLLKISKRNTALVILFIDIRITYQIFNKRVNIVFVVWIFSKFYIIII